MARGATAPARRPRLQGGRAARGARLYDQAEPVYGRLLHSWQALAQRPEIFTAYLP